MYVAASSVYPHPYEFFPGWFYFYYYCALHLLSMQSTKTILKDAIRAAFVGEYQCDSQVLTVLNTGSYCATVEKCMCLIDILILWLN